MLDSLESLVSDASAQQSICLNCLGQGMPWVPQTDYLQYIALIARRLLRLSVSLSTCLSVCCLSQGLSVCLSLPVFISARQCLSVCDCQSVSICLSPSGLSYAPSVSFYPQSLSLYVSVFVSLRLCLSVCLSLSLLICVSLSLSINRCFSLSLSVSISQSPRQCPCLIVAPSQSVVSLSLWAVLHSLCPFVFAVPESVCLSVSVSVCLFLSVSEAVSLSV